MKRGAHMKNPCSLEARFPVPPFGRAFAHASAARTGLARPEFKWPIATCIALQAHSVGATRLTKARSRYICSAPWLAREH